MVSSLSMDAPFWLLNHMAKAMAYQNSGNCALYSWPEVIIPWHTSTEATRPLSDMRNHMLSGKRQMFPRSCMFVCVHACILMLLLLLVCVIDVSRIYV